MEREIIGKYGLAIKTSTVFLMLVCQTDLKFSRSRGVINAPSKCDPNKKIPSPTGDYELTGSLQVLLPDGVSLSDARASEAELDQIFRDITIFDWKIGPISDQPEPGDVIYSGKGWFSKLDTDYPTADLAKSDFTLSVTGEYSQLRIPATT